MSSPAPVVVEKMRLTMNSLQNLEILTGIFEVLDPDCERVAVHINSGNRCEAYDKAMKLKNNLPIKDKPSEHLFNWACDFYMEYVYPDTDQRKHIDDDLVADKLETLYPNEHGIGRYVGRTHYDVRINGPAKGGIYDEWI